MGKKFLADAMAFPSHPLLGPAWPDARETKLDLGIVTSVPPDKTDFQSIMAEHAKFKGLLQAQRLPGKILFGLQHPPIDLDSDTPLGIDYDKVKAMKEAGIVTTTIAYGGDSPYGGGFLSAEGKTLTKKGRCFALACWRAGIVIDLAHANDPTALDLAMMANEEGVREMVIDSHTGAREVFEHRRNHYDATMGWTARIGGLVGVFTITFFLDKGSNDSEAFLSHIGHCLRVVGEDHLVIGSDSPYSVMEQDWWEGQTALMKQRFDPDGKFGIRWPDYIPELVGPDKMVRIHGLLQGRFGESVADKVCGQNLRRFWWDKDIGV